MPEKADDKEPADEEIVKYWEPSRKKRRYEQEAPEVTIKPSKKSVLHDNPKSPE